MAKKKQKQTMSKTQKMNVNNNSNKVTGSINNITVSNCIHTYIYDTWQNIIQLMS